jgi:hypothetical protein
MLHTTLHQFSFQRQWFNVQHNIVQ